MDPQDTQNLIEALNRIADEIAAHLSWMREQREAENMQRTQVPPVDYQVRMLNGQWPKRDGDSYGPK